MVDFPDDGKYRGIEIPLRLQRYWNNTSGRWWCNGVDSALDSPQQQKAAEDAWKYGELQ